MDWFERLTGFAESDYEATRSRLAVVGTGLVSRINGRSWGIGDLELAALGDLRNRVAMGTGATGRLTLRNVTGDVRMLHQAPEYANALFQVASQFNLLEMMSPEATPEDGVTGYQNDGTQGPACAIAAGAATIYRNYFVPVAGDVGQTRDRQVDTLVDLGAALCTALSRAPEDLWAMRNGYALCTGDGLAAINGYLRAASPAELDHLRGRLRIGLHRDVEATDGDSNSPRLVSQAFCSALPVGYSRLPASSWEPFARLVLDAAYEATLLAAVLNARRGASNIVLLTRLGGGVFGNHDTWISEAMERALSLVRDFALDVRIVSHGPVPVSMRALETAFM
jgi:hypothetical protein